MDNLPHTLKNLIYTYIIGVFILSFGFSTSLKAEDNHRINLSKPTVNFGVLSFRDKELTQQRWQPLMDHLNQQIPHYHFHLIVANYPEIEQLVTQQKLDFLLTQPSHYVALAHRHNLTSPLLSMTRKEKPLDVAYSQFSGVIFTLADREDINELADLTNKTIATPSKQSLGAYQMQLFELVDAGVITSAQQLTFLKTGLPQELVIEKVLSKQADVGFVRSGVLEKLFMQKTILPEQIKIINQQNHSDFSKISSTRLYPEWPLTAFKHTSQNLPKKVMIALMRINFDTLLAKQLRVSGFTIAEDYRVIDQLLEDLRLPPFDKPIEFSLADAWQEWRNYILFLITLIFSLSFLSIWNLAKKNRQLLHSKKKLEQSEQLRQKLHLAIEQSPIRIVITNFKGQIEYANKAVEQQTGYTFEETHLKNPKIFSSQEMPRSYYKELWETITKGKNWTGELINLSKKGERQILKATITPIKDNLKNITGFLSVQRDITQEKSDQEKINQLAFYDLLTKLPNRALLEKNISEEINRHIHQELVLNNKNHSYSYLALINIDRFKLLNDSQGKDLGDEFLIKLAKQIKSCLAKEDFLSHLKGDEFAILFSLPASQNIEEQAIQRADTFLQNIKKTLVLNQKQISVTASIGLTSFTEEDSGTSNDILKHADTALHYAKDQGGNRVCTFNTSLKEQASNSFQLEQDLKKAISKNQFQLYYQPQVNIAGELVGSEALIRWKHPEKGLIPPFKFIPIAEQSEIIIGIGNWVIKQACEDLALAKKQGFKYHLSINISPRQFLENDFCYHLYSSLESNGISTKDLTLEITEGLFLHNLEIVLPKMQLLVKKGFAFSIDDFGTGYSSLSYLKDLPFDELKIDRAFIMNMFKDNNVILVETILSIAQHMNLSVVVEGIETQKQANFFHNYHNTTLQGYLYSKPAPYEELYNTWKDKAL